LFSMFFLSPSRRSDTRCYHFLPLIFRETFSLDHLFLPPLSVQTGAELFFRFLISHTTAAVRIPARAARTVLYWSVITSFPPPKNSPPPPLGFRALDHAVGRRSLLSAVDVCFFPVFSGSRSPFLFPHRWNTLFLFAVAQAYPSDPSFSTFSPEEFGDLRGPLFPASSERSFFFSFSSETKTNCFFELKGVLPLIYEMSLLSLRTIRLFSSFFLGWNKGVSSSAMESTLLF